MLTRSQTAPLLKIFCELLLYSQVICKSMNVADLGKNICSNLFIPVAPQTCIQILQIIFAQRKHFENDIWKGNVDRNSIDSSFEKVL